jgi:hypothetical protein
MPFIKSSEYLCGIATGENIVGNERRKREGEKENSRLTGWERERLSEMEMAGFVNGR